MSGTKREKRSKTAWLPLLGYLLIGMACGLGIVRYVDRLRGGGMSAAPLLARAALLVVCMYGALLVQLIIHEAGHLVFGLASGYRFNAFRIFSLMWIRENGRLRLKRMSVAGTGGQCLMNPPDLKDGKMPVMLYNFGGALMNLASALVFGGIALLCPAVSFARTVLLFPVIIGFAFALINGIPIGTGVVNNDGRNALDLSRSPAAVRAFWIMMKVNQLTSEGVRVRDMPEEWFAAPPEEEADNGIVATVSVLACGRLMDEKRFEEAEQRMSSLLSGKNGVVGLYRALLTCDRVFLELIGRKRQEVLEGMLDKNQRRIMKAMRQYPSVLRTEYAYALLGEKDPGKAETFLKQFDKAADSYPYPGEIEGERELIALAAEKAE